MSEVNDEARTQRLRQHLMWRIHRRYQTRTETLAIGPLSVAFTRIADPDRVLDEVAEEEDRREKASGRRLDGDDLHLPYWAELWDSALGLAQVLVHGGAVGCVLDLGCGMGLAGSVAAAMGAKVVFADLESPALLFAALNSLPWRKRVRTRRIDWRRDVLSERFDLILGADIVYERAQWPHLEAFWRRHLAAGGSVLLGEPGRQTGELFAQWIIQQGWTLQRRQQAVETRRQPIHILCLRRQ